MTSGLRIFATAAPTQRGMAGTRLQPMSEADRRLWQRLAAQRRARAQGTGQ